MAVRHSARKRDVFTFALCPRSAGMRNDLRLVLVVLIASHARDREAAWTAKLQTVDGATHGHAHIILDGRPAENCSASSVCTVAR